MAEPAVAAPWRAALDALRARGAQRSDPHRVDLAEALARRAAAHEGAARRVIDARLMALVEAIDAGLAGTGPVPADAVPAVAPVPRPLADLLDHLARQKASRPSHDAAQTLDFFRRTWARASAEQRIAQSQSALPANAGPLHSQHVVHRSLTLMRALSPAYFARFVGYVDVLLWLEQNPVAEPGGGRKGPARRG